MRQKPGSIVHERYITKLKNLKRVMKVLIIEIISFQM